MTNILSKEAQITSVTGYHGTDCDFEVFECPAYFADNQDTAAYFANCRRGNPRVLKCSLGLKNPLIVDMGGQSWGGFFLADEKLQKGCIEYASQNDATEVAYFEQNGLAIGFLADYAECLGYDSLVAYNCYEEDNSYGTQYVVFKPENIMIQEKILCFKK